MSAPITAQIYGGLDNSSETDFLFLWSLTQYAPMIQTILMKVTGALSGETTLPFLFLPPLGANSFL